MVGDVYVRGSKELIEMMRDKVIVRVTTDKSNDSNLLCIADYSFNPGIRYFYKDTYCQGWPECMCLLQGRLPIDKRFSGHLLPLISSWNGAAHVDILVYMSIFDRFGKQ